MTIRDVARFLRVVRRAVAAAEAGDPLPDPAAIPPALLGLVPCGPELWGEGTGRRVAILTREYPDETLYGGMGTFAHRAARGLHALGDRVVVITEATTASRIERTDGFPVIRLRTDATIRSLGGILPALLFSAAAAVQLERLGGADVVDVADFAAEGLWATTARPERTNVRCYSPWTLLGTMRIDPHRPRDLRIAHLLEGRVLRSAAAVDAGSADLAWRVRALFGVTTPIDVVPSPAPGDDLFHEQRTPTEGPLVCFVGRLDGRKGGATLLAALPHLWQRRPDARVRIIGSDRRGLLRSHPAVAADERLEHHGHVPLAEVARLTAGCDVAVVPSLYDNAPLSLVEHLASGARIVATTAGGAPEYLAGTEHRLVPPRAPLALAAAIGDLLDRHAHHGPRAPEHGPFDASEVAVALRAHHDRLQGHVSTPASPLRPLQPVDDDTARATSVEVVIDGRGASGRAVRATARAAVAAGAEPVAVVSGDADRPPVCAARIVRHPSGGDPLALALATVTMPRVVVMRAGSDIDRGLLVEEGADPSALLARHQAGEDVCSPQRAKAARAALPDHREMASGISHRLVSSTDHLRLWHTVLLLRAALRRQSWGSTSTNTATTKATS